MPDTDTRIVDVRRRCCGRARWDRFRGRGPRALRAARRGGAIVAARRRSGVLGRHALHADGGVQPRPLRARGSRAPGHPRDALRRRTARVRGWSRHLLSGLHGPWCHVGRCARRACGGRDRPRGPGPGRQLLRRRVHQPAAPPGLGPGPGDLRRRSAPPRGDGRGARAGRAALDHGLRQALRAQLHGERTLHRGRDGRRGGSPRRLPAALQAGGRRGRRRHHGCVQLRQRGVVRAEHLSPHHRAP